MSGQSLSDRLAAAHHSVTGSAVAKAVCKASTHQMQGPKQKHLDYLIHCTNELNMSIPQLADTLLERTTSSSWVVVFKALITTHHLMMYGNERFMQYLASRNTLFNLSNFLDKSIIQGYDMSTFIRRYSRYLNEKALSYRMVAVDFTKMKRGPEGVMRTMSSDKLLKTLPIIQNQLDVLLDFDAHPNELTNGVITSAFIHLFKDSIRLFATYNEGIINLLEKYFDMKKNQCKEGLDSYKKFLGRMAKLSEFLKVAEQIGIDQADIPDLTQAPSSLFEALEQHVASLEDRKSKEISTVYKADNLLSAVSSLTNTGKAFSRVVEPKKHTFDPQFFSQAWKEKHFRDSPVTRDGASTSGSPRIAAEKTTSASPAPELPVPLVPTPASLVNISEDLFGLQSSFVFPRQNTADTMGALGNPNWEMGLPPLTLPNSTYSEMPMDFESLFETRLPEPAPVAAAWDGEFGTRPCQAKSNLEFNYTVTPGTSMAQEHPGAEVNQQPESVLRNDLDTSLANLMGSLDFGTRPQKSDIQWNHHPHEKKMTGGTNWQVSSASTSSAIWNPTTITSVPNVVPAPMNYPVTTHQLPVYGMVPTPFGSVCLMTPPPLICAQPGMRAPNPFAPVSGPQNFSQNNFM